MNSSISITLSALSAKVTVEFSEKYEQDFATLNGKEAEGKILERSLSHIGRIRKLAGIHTHARGAVEINFPVGVGLASSSAGFAALTLAAARAAGLKLSPRALSILSRRGSGSSSRSIFGGFVEWKAARTSEGSYSYQIAPPSYWDIRILTAVTSTTSRKTDTRGGMEIAKNTSPLYAARLKAVEKDLLLCRKAVKQKNLPLLGEVLERETMLLHATALTASPLLMYLTPETIRVMREVLGMRTEEKIPAYFTTDTGANVHVFTLPKYEGEVAKRLRTLPGVREVHHNKPGEGAKLVNKHLF